MNRLLTNAALLAIMLAGLAVITGCATAPAVMPAVVKVPVAQPCPAAQPTARPPRPASAVAGITAGAGINQKAEALDADAENMTAYADALETLLDACK